MSNVLYGIEENKNWFVRVFKRQGKQYTLYSEREVRVNVESWMWENIWVKDIILNSNDLESLNKKLDNLRVIR